MRWILMLAILLASCSGPATVPASEVCSAYADTMIAWETDCADYAVDEEDRAEWLGICSRALGSEPVDQDQADRCDEDARALTCESLEYPFSCYRR